MNQVTENCGCALQDDVSVVNSPVCSGVLLFMVLIESYIRRACDISTPCKNVRSTDELEPSYDYIVVGAGAGGSVVAGRLSEDNTNKVLVIEAGGPEPTGARVPGFYRAYWGNELVDWAYRTVPGDYCLDQGDKGCQWPRGKVLGGSTVLNGMMYHRGHPQDYEDWVSQGAKGWSWEENLPFFDKNEGNKQVGSLVKSEFHSSTGAMPVQRFNYQGPEIDVLLQILNETGLPVIEDMNNPNTPIGFTVAQAFNDNGQRYTPARVFLKPKTEQPNLTVKLHSTVTKVIFKNKRAVGVEYLDKYGKKNIVRAKKEIILSAGALNTPHILLLSGIGPRKVLKSFNIPVVANLPVGQHLKNHVGVTVNFILTKLNDTRTLDWNTFMTYMLSRGGPMSSTGITQLTGIMYSSLANQSLQQPDLQFFFNGFYAECSKTGVIGEVVDDDRQQTGLNITANVVSLIPRSVGNLTLQSTDPLVPPLFYPNFFTDPSDIVMIKDGMMILKKIFDSTTMREKFGIQLDAESIEECSSSGAEWSDSWMECMIRLHTDPQNHQMGTTAIGHVVDSELKVYNVRGLRVVDASSMPAPVTGNPQGAIMMVAERAAEFIKNSFVYKQFL